MPQQSILDVNGVERFFERPSDCPPYVEVPEDYAAGTAETQLKDRNTVGHIMDPSVVTEPDFTNWTFTSGSRTVLDQGNLSGTESKTRFLVGFHSFIYDDSIRSFGAPGTSHLHMVMGGPMNSWQTYVSGRKRAAYAASTVQSASSSPGGPINATPYWFPALLNANGEPLTAANTTVYYVFNPASGVLRATRLPVGARFVGGCDMEDPLGEKRILLAEQMNAKAGTAGRYTTNGNGFNGWSLLDQNGAVILTTSGDSLAPYLKGPNDENPWGAAGADARTVRAHIVGPQFWDATNLWGPGGYCNTSYGLRDAVNGNFPTTGGTVSGPTNYAAIPHPLLIPKWLDVCTQGGFEYLDFTLVSDAHAEMVAGQPIGVGQSFHVDWLGLWDERYFDDVTGWQKFCTPTVDGFDACDCNSGHVTDTLALIGGAGGNAPDGTRVPQVGNVALPPSPALAKLGFRTLSVGA